MASIISISLIVLFIFMGCSSSETRNEYQGVLDDGRTLPIVLTSISVVDTTIKLSGPPPSNKAETTHHQTPLPKITVQPVYPEALRKANIQGMVWVKALITPTGDVAQASIMKTEHEGFNQSALRAVIQWKYDPDIVGSAVVGEWVVIPMRFRLNP